MRWRRICAGGTEARRVKFTRPVDPLQRARGYVQRSQRDPARADAGGGIAGEHRDRVVGAGARRAGAGGLEQRVRARARVSATPPGSRRFRHLGPPGWAWRARTRDRRRVPPHGSQSRPRRRRAACAARRVLRIALIPPVADADAAVGLRGSTQHGSLAQERTGTRVISTRRFCARPASVSLLAIGRVLPAPVRMKRSRIRPLDIR